jgi:hypothetical protein
MTKSEKSAIADAIAMLNAIVNGNDENGNNNHQPASSDEENYSEENPPEKEIVFVRKMANDEPFGIIGLGVRPKEGPIANIRIGRACFNRMITAYLEKYCHE